MRKPIYRRKDLWVLGSCEVCRTLNYVEPHGTTADCKKCKRETYHDHIPQGCRDFSGCYMVRSLPA